MSFDGVAALREINRFIDERNSQKEPLNETETRALETVRRDAMHAVLNQQDASLFREFDRLKLVELEYLYQVRGVRQVVPSAVFGEGYAGYGNGWTGSRIRLLYQQDRKRAGRLSREPFLPINKINETADLSEQLVPLRINITTEKHRLRDRLLWNADDTSIPLELFIENTLEDYGLPLTLAPQVSQMLQEQISSHLPHIFPSPNADPPPNASPSSGTKPSLNTSPSPDVSSETAEKGEKEKPYDEDMRITIKLDITIGHHQLIDQFEWDINNPENDPEMFGVILANELALPQEFGPAVAHAIREQAQAFTRALFLRGYQFDGTLPSDQQLQSGLSLPVDEHAFLRRPEMLPLFSPALNDANITGLNPDHHEQEQERRELRSRRRQGRSSRRGHHHDGRAGGATTNNGDVTFTAQDPTGPDFCTPLYSSVLPGGLDRNLDILHMTAYHSDEVYGGERQDVLYYFHKHRREREVPSASQFESGLVVDHKPRWLVKLKLPKRNSN